MRIACLPVAALALSTAAMAQTFLKPGLYEFTTIVTDVSGVPPMIAAQMKSQRNSMQRCLTQDAAAKGTRQWMEETNPGCRFSRFAVTGNHVDMTMACTGPGGARSLAASGDVTPTGYAETGTMKYASGPMTMQFVRTFKRIGNCK